MTNQREVDARYMRLALNQAEIALASDLIPVGAVFVRDGRVITNGAKTGLVHPHFDHAEHNGCYQALWSPDGPRNLEGVTAYSTLEPCVMCMAMLMTVRVSRIVWACHDPYGGGSFILRQTDRFPERFAKERPILDWGVLDGDSRRLLRRFFEPKIGKGGTWSNPNNALVWHVMHE